MVHPIKSRLGEDLLGFIISLEVKLNPRSPGRGLIYCLLPMPLERRRKLSEAHTWLSDADISALLVKRYMKFSREYSPETTQILLDNYVTIACQLTEDELKNQLARVKEFCSN